MKNFIGFAVQYILLLCFFKFAFDAPAWAGIGFAWVLAKLDWTDAA